MFCKLPLNSALFCVAVFSSIAVLADEKKETEERLRSLVYQGFENYRSLRDSGFGRSIVLAQEENVTEIRGKRKFHLFTICVQAFEGNSNDSLTFLMRLDAPSLRRNNYQSWNEKHQLSDRLVIRNGAPTKGYRYVIKQDDESMHEFYARASYRSKFFNPLSFVLTLPSLHYDSKDHPNFLEKEILRFYEYSHAVFLSNGDVRSHWRMDAGDARDDVTLVQSKSNSYLPTLLTLAGNKSRGGDPGKRIENRTVWQKIGGRTVPIRMDFYSAYHGLVAQRAMILDWKFDEDVPDYMFEPDWNDHRDKLEKLYGLPIDRSKPNGVMIPAAHPYEPPERLTRANERQLQRRK